MMPIITRSADREPLAVALRSLAQQAHQVLSRGQSYDREELRETLDAIEQLRARLDGQGGPELHQWLDRLEARLEALQDGRDEPSASVRSLHRPDNEPSACSSVGAC